MKIQNKIKNNLNSNNNTIKNEDNEIKKLIYLIVGVTLVFFIFYGLTVLITKEDGNTTQNLSTSKIEYDKILAGNILEKNDDKYYVLAVFNDDESLGAYLSLLTTYYEKENHLPFYQVDLNDTFNKSFISDKSNLKVDSINNIKFTQSTLLEIKDKKIINAYEGNEQIVSKFQEISE